MFDGKCSYIFFIFELGVAYILGSCVDSKGSCVGSMGSCVDSVDSCVDNMGSCVGSMGSCVDSKGSCVDSMGSCVDSKSISYVELLTFCISEWLAAFSF
jgi:hypothetical protein